jgi:acetylornithine deacetylase/succinyl-diaminopimelate desuccinylase-like protein
MLDTVLSTIDATRAQSLDRLKSFLKIPSVSTKPDHKPDMQRCAEFLANEFRACGLTPTIHPTPGHPILVAKNHHQPNRPTVLLYGHYDVQPPEPLADWTTPPFEPTIRNDENGHPAIYARGAVDDKGQVWCHLEALRAWHHAGSTGVPTPVGMAEAPGNLPVNLTVLIEGEEEIGSINLENFLRTHAADLKADIAVVSDTNQFARGLPAITYGLRGLVYTEVTLTGPSHDLHSGLYGGTLQNPANALCQLLASLHNPDGSVNIQDFYTDVRQLTPREREIWSKLPFNDESHRNEMGVPHLFGEAGFTTLERKWARPTLDINGLTSGYQGPGAKTIIPAKASAKVSMRLVPDQDPKKIEAAFRRALESRVPKTVTLDIRVHSGAHPSLLPIDNPATQLAAKAVQTGFGVAPVFMREGGTVPVGTLFKTTLGIDTLFIGFGLSDDRVHSPNEKFDLDALHKGTRTAAALYAELANL